MLGMDGANLQCLNLGNFNVFGDKLRVHDWTLDDDLFPLHAWDL